MGRWKVHSTPSECQMKCEMGVITGHSNEDDAGYAVLETEHNADCDAYEARIAELEAKLARVKAESLRVVEETDRPLSELYKGSRFLHEGEVWEKITGWKVLPIEAHRVTHGPFQRFSESLEVTVARLERWETADGN